MHIGYFIKRYHVWDKNELYQGIIEISSSECLDFTLCPHYLYIEPPDCPALSGPKYKYPDGWYFVKFEGERLQTAREKRGDRVYNEQGDPVITTTWSDYEVVASLGDIKFLDGRGE